MSTTGRDSDRSAARTEIHRPGGRRRWCRHPPQKPHPEREIKIAAFVPNLDTLLAELPEPRNLLPQRLCDRAYHGDRLNLRKSHPCLRHHIRGHSKLALASQHETVLFLDLGAPHQLTPTAS